MIFSKANLFKLKKALLSLSETATEEGVVLVYDGDTLEPGAEVFIDGEDGLTPAPDKTYVSGDSKIEVVGGKVVSIVEKEIEQPVEEEVVEETIETAEEVKEEETEETVEETVEDETTEEETVEEEVIEEPSVDELNTIIEEQKKVIEDLKKEIEDLKAKLEEPAAPMVEDEFKNQKPAEKQSKIDFSKYIRTNK